MIWYNYPLTESVFILSNTRNILKEISLHFSSFSEELKDIYCSGKETVLELINVYEV